MAEPLKYRLPKQFEKFTGNLNNVYPVIEGVAIIPAKAEEKAGKYLMEHYGAVKIVPEAKKEEAKK
jgi:hypothetical protein